jgi:cyclopropane-fatty-acyl-phospholipid synthase
MSQNKAKEKIKELLFIAGININGKQDWDIQVNNENLYRRVIAEGSLGIGEAYMDGWWDVPRLDIFFLQSISTRAE